MSENNKSDASKALRTIYNNVNYFLDVHNGEKESKVVNTLLNLLSENNKLLRGIYSQKNNVSNTIQPPRFTVKNMTDAQLKDLILQGLNFEFIYYLSNRKFSIEYIQQVAQKIK